ncbi:hypothetical protein [Streptomyces sp. PSKA30]|uniref:hypothetical protein n=1 Tax=Streptomyces sp. PSKA30 TaxID=2874597 RepID=UPI001CD1360E|nr:hypothetical protein [Streptomyces sp. PSKA30]MBZ9643955.1 hypothetical protein [Streptomyces sp. PSKA30]
MVCRDGPGRGLTSVSHTIKDNDSGASQTISAGTTAQGEPFKSSGFDDGHGNASTTSVTYHDNGSYTIITSSKDATGHGTIDFHTYDKQGQEIPGGSTGSGHHDPHGTTSEMPPDDGSSPPDEFGIDYGPLL